MDDGTEVISQDVEIVGTASAAEYDMLEAIVRKHVGRKNALPEGVLNLGIRFGEDSVGDAAVWIVARVTDDLNPSADKIAAIRRFLDTVQREIFESGIKRWPYFEIVAE